MFLSLIKKGLLAKIFKKNVKDNSSKDERCALNELRKDNLFNKLAIWSCDYMIKTTDLL